MVVSYERVRVDGAREKTILENGQAWGSLEWPAAGPGQGARLEFSGPRPLNEVEKSLVTMALLLPGAPATSAINREQAALYQQQKSSLNSETHGVTRQRSDDDPAQLAQQLAFARALISAATFEFRSSIAPASGRPSE